MIAAIGFTLFVLGAWNLFNQMKYVIETWVKQDEERKPKPKNDITLRANPFEGETS